VLFVAVFLAAVFFVAVFFVAAFVVTNRPGDPFLPLVTTLFGGGGGSPIMLCPSAVGASVGQADLEAAWPYLPEDDRGTAASLEVEAVNHACCHS
jgi:hypothetical protein